MGSSSRRSRRRSRRPGPCAGHHQGRLGRRPGRGQPPLPPRGPSGVRRCCGASRPGPGRAAAGPLPRARYPGLVAPRPPLVPGRRPLPRRVRQVRRFGASGRRPGTARSAPRAGTAGRPGRWGVQGCSSVGAGEAAPNSLVRGFATSAAFVCTASAAAAGAGSISVVRGNQERISCGKGAVFAPGVPLEAGRELAFRELRGTETRQGKQCTRCAGHNVS